MSKTLVEIRREQRDQVREEYRAIQAKLIAANKAYQQALAKEPDEAARAYNRQAAKRTRVLRQYPVFRRFRGKTRKQALDEYIAKNIDRPRRYEWDFDVMFPSGPSKPSRGREVFKLYRAALKLRAMTLRQEAAGSDRAKQRSARILEQHLSTLHDVAPRSASCYYPHEWKEISRALRPFGSNPNKGKNKDQGKRAMQLYSMYKTIRAKRKEAIVHEQSLSDKAFDMAYPHDLGRTDI